MRRLVASVRFRVTALASLAVLAVLVTAAVVLVTAQRRMLTESVHETVEGHVEDIAELVEDGQLPDRITGLSDDDKLAQVVDGSGTVLAASANVEGLGPVGDPPPAGRDKATMTVADLPTDDTDFRLVSRRLEGPDGEVVVHVAASLDDVDESVAVLTTSLSIAVPAVAAILAALLWWLVGRTLRPVEAIRAEATAITGSELHRRVPEPGTGDEIDGLAHTMNAMLDRIEDAVRRQQQFVADASHELRTPLTRIRAELEVDEAHPSTADPSATRRSVLAETVGLQHMVDDLLLLARSDAGAAVTEDEPVDLDDLVLRQVRRLRSTGRVDVDCHGLSAAQVRGDADQLGRAIANVVDNAVRHAARTVTCTLAATNGTAVLGIADDGPGIPVDQRETIFDRFTRLDESRQEGSGGTGLGLAIARDIVERHGGTIDVDPEHRHGARFVIRLPQG